MPEPTGQRIADDDDEHGRHGREREQRGDDRPDDVEDPLRDSARLLATGGADGDGVGEAADSDAGSLTVARQLPVASGSDAAMAEVPPTFWLPFGQLTAMVR